MDTSNFNTLPEDIDEIARQVDKLIPDINKHGAMLEMEALSVYGEDVLDLAKARNLIKCIETEIGDIIYLAYKGRIKAGLTGDYKPGEQSLMNAVFLRQVDKDLEERGYKTTTDERRQSIAYYDNGKKIIVLARQNGYTRIAIRRIYRQAIVENEFSEMHVYCYNTGKIDMLKMRDVYCEPRQGKNALDPEKFKLFNVKAETFKKDQ